MVDEVSQIFYYVMKQKLTRAKPSTDVVEISETLEKIGTVRSSTQARFEWERHTIQPQQWRRYPTGRRNRTYLKGEEGTRMSKSISARISMTATFHRAGNGYIGKVDIVSGETRFYIAILRNLYHLMPPSCDILYRRYIWNSIHWSELFPFACSIFSKNCGAFHLVPSRRLSSWLCSCQDCIRWASRLVTSQAMLIMWVSSR